MSRPHYKAILYDAFERYAELVKQRDAIMEELDKLSEFIEATINLLPESERTEFTNMMAVVAKIHVSRLSSLTEAVKQTLRDAAGEYLTAAQVRDRLISSGFDFSDYTSNPLASVSTTLRRMKPEDVKMIEHVGVATYRWVGTKSYGASNSLANMMLAQSETEQAIPPPKFSEKLKARKKD